MQGHAKSALAPRTRETISFGPFSLVASERLLTKDGAPVLLGARALDILIALLSRPNEAISKRELMARAWPDVTVEESNLRFHIVSLRRALGDGKDGARYITTLAGRGYCFVAPVARANVHDPEVGAAAGSFPHLNLPARLTRIVGRDEDVLKVSTQLTATRFVTIVGVGGVGKTTVSVAVGHHLIEAFGGAVLFVDLSMLSDPALVATAVASAMGLSVQSDDATPSLLAYLRDKRILLILDTCEHLIEVVAVLASRISLAAPDIHILATSREALQVEGEHVFRLGSLACPPDDLGLTAAVARTFPATQLFIERAMASGARLEFGDAEAATVVAICRKLDGVALAIELAARRVETYGLRETAALLDQRLTLLWLGSRTAPPRQKTLQATLDWSYGLLTAPERVVLRRLAVFVGHFTMDAVLAVVTGGTVDQAHVFSAIDSLVAKSMVATHPVGAMMRYRLLDTTRAYALDIAFDESERADLAVRHATYFLRWVEQSGKEWTASSTGAEWVAHFANLNNVRAALEWCLGESGDVRTGVRLAAAAAPVFLAMSLLPECHRWSERAILALDNAEHGESEEMHLQMSLGVASMHMYGPSDAARVALSRSLAIAEARGKIRNQVGLLGTLSMFYTRDGEFRAALHYAQRTRAAAAIVDEPPMTALAQSTLGRALHFMGDHGGARAELEAAFQHWSRAQRTYLGFDDNILVGIGLARTLWLQGLPDHAANRARQTVKEAERSNNSASLAIALAWIPGIFIWTGDLQTAEEHANRLITLAEYHSLGPYLSVGRGYKGTLAIRWGDAKSGVKTLQGCLERLHAVRYEMRNTEFKIALTQGLVALGHFDEALTLIDDTIKQVAESGDLLFMPEALRVKGCVLLPMQKSRPDDAEACFMPSLELSRRQGARAWELRTATDLAALWASQGRSDEARALLQSAFAQFTEGLETADLKAAERLLATLAR
jgi:predicted ATPase/DNA-binding winged helix-turn-helix (wHTH) protein